MVRDLHLGGLLFKYKDGQTEFADIGEDCGSWERVSRRLLPPQLHGGRQRVRQPRATDERGGVRLGAPKRDPPQGFKDVQLQSGLRENRTQQEGDAVQLRPIKDM